MKRNNILIICLLVLFFALSSCQQSQEGDTGATSIVDATPTFPAATVTQIREQTVIPTLSVEAVAQPTEQGTLGLQPYPDPKMISLTMFTELRGWAVTQDGNRLLVTEDGGDTWLDATPPDLQSLPDGIAFLGIRPFFLDENTVWFSPFNREDSMLYHTQDGGRSWSDLPLPFTNARYVFFDGNTGVALVDLGAGAGSHYVAIYRTEDGGKNWESVFSHETGDSTALPAGGSKSSFVFRDPMHGWISGTIPIDNFFYLYTTQDGGITWVEESDIQLPEIFSGSFLEVREPIFLATGEAYLPVRALTSSGENQLLIYHSADNGQSWSFRSAIQDGLSVDFVTGERGMVAARTSLQITVDGAISWMPAALTGIPEGDILLFVDFVDELHGWVVTTADEATLEPLNLYRTGDGGESWRLLNP